MPIGHVPNLAHIGSGLHRGRRIELNRGDPRARKAWAVSLEINCSRVCRRIRSRCHRQCHRPPLGLDCGVFIATDQAPDRVLGDPRSSPFGQEFRNLDEQRESFGTCQRRGPRAPCMAPRWALAVFAVRTGRCLSHPRSAVSWPWQPPGGEASIQRSRKALIRADAPGFSWGVHRQKTMSGGRRGLVHLRAECRLRPAAAPTQLATRFIHDRAAVSVTILPGGDAGRVEYPPP